MEIDLFLATSKDRWTAAPPAPPGAIPRLVADSGTAIPADYLEFLGRCNGGDGFLDVQPCYLRIWAAEDVVRNNVDYQMPAYVPGFFAFGDCGGGEFFAFDTRTGEPCPIVAIPFVPMDAEYAIHVAPSFSELLDHVEPASN